MSRREQIEPGWHDDWHDFSPERQLWCAVILQAVTDAKSTNPYLRDPVERWIGSYGFRRACEFAGLDAEDVSAKFRSVLASRKAPSHQLTLARIERDKRILELLAEGFGVTRIADELGLARATVSNTKRRHGPDRMVGSITQETEPCRTLPT